MCDSEWVVCLIGLNVASACFSNMTYFVSAYLLLTLAVAICIVPQSVWKGREDIPHLTISERNDKSDTVGLVVAL
jgi:hypothetical protein